MRIRYLKENITHYTLEIKSPIKSAIFSKETDFFFFKREANKLANIGYRGKNSKTIRCYKGLVRIIY